MSGCVYSLLVGIDDYQPPVPQLHGCAADVAAFGAFLSGRIPAGQSHVVTLLNERATYSAIVSAFRDHLGQAGDGDVALFYYSGHGSQAPTAKELWNLEPDRLDETIVCYDSRTGGAYDLADKELASLIADVARRNPHVVVLLDSCHSGSGTREVESVGIRRAPTDSRQRPVETYLVAASDLAGGALTRGDEGATSGWTQLAHGRHVLLSACRSDEEAKEIRFEDRTRGVFSYFLLEALQSSTALTYRDLFARVNALVRAKVARQSPVIEATDFEDLDRPFLGGAIRPHPPYFVATHVKDRGWTIDGGVIHGLPKPIDGETTHLAVFRGEAASVDDSSLVIGSARVTGVEPTRSWVDLVLEDGAAADPQLTYKAVVMTLPLPPLRVRLEGESAALDRVRQELAGAGANNRPSLLVREATQDAELTVTAQDDEYRITRVGDDRPLYAVVEHRAAENPARRAVEYVEHIARWMRMAALSNPSSRLPPDAVRIDIFRVDAAGRSTLVDLVTTGSGLRLDYEYRDGEWHEPLIRVRLVNTTKRRLYCMLFDLTDRFKMTAALLPGGGVWLEPAPKHEAWAMGGEPLPASIPDELWEQGMTEYRDLLKLVVTTEECRATDFEQENIEVRYESRGTRDAGSLSTLERLMQRVHTREIGSTGAKDRLADWMTREIGITTVRPLEGARLPRRGESVSLAPRVTIVGHPRLEATARLTTVPLASREAVGAPPIPPWLRDDPSDVRPFELSASRSADAPLSVLELSDVTAHDAVTADEPLELRVDARLAEGEHVVPIAYDPDGDCFIPIGRTSGLTDGIRVRIEQLPRPTADTRSLTGSVKIYFQKVISQTLGLAYKYPLLRALDANGHYIDSIDEIRARLRAAARIVLYVHGIIGDTREMSASGYRPAPNVKPALDAVATRYDVVLTFDYENLNTSIEANARALKRQLEQVGLGPAHGKALHIAAHSMGGLVSRWFIEREGGNAVVQHLVMLGTPNAGSPWPTIQDWAMAAIGLGLNGLTTVAWPAKALGALVAAVERIDIPLDEMRPQSDFLRSLEASPDPGVPYTILAGNTAVIGAALAGADGKASRLERLLTSMRLRPALHKAASLAFFGSPNDVAVSVESICRVPGKRASPVVIREVACDHMSYFTSESGLRALAGALPLPTALA